MLVLVARKEVVSHKLIAIMGCAASVCNIRGEAVDNGKDEADKIVERVYSAKRGDDIDFLAVSFPKMCTIV